MSAVMENVSGTLHEKPRYASGAVVRMLMEHGEHLIEQRLVFSGSFRPQIQGAARNSELFGDSSF
jgi:hypothetical protein